MILLVSKQLAIRDLLGGTAIIGIWFAMFVASPDMGWLFLGVALTFGAALILRRVFPLFFLPLVFSANLILLINFRFSLDVPSAAVLIGYIFAFIIAVSEFTIRRTCIKFRHQTTRKGVVWKAIQNGVLSGVFVAFQFGLPVLVSCVATWFTAFPVPIGTLVRMAMVFPLVACTTFGAMLGGLLGLFCVRLIALDDEKRQTLVGTMERESLR